MNCPPVLMKQKGRQSFLEALNARNAEYYKQIDEYSKKLTELNAQYEYEKLQKEWHAPDTSEIDKKL